MPTMADEHFNDNDTANAADAADVADAADAADAADSCVLKKAHKWVQNMRIETSTGQVLACIKLLPTDTLQSVIECCNQEMRSKNIKMEPVNRLWFAGKTLTSLQHVIESEKHNVRVTSINQPPHAFESVEACVCIQCSGPLEWDRRGDTAVEDACDMYALSVDICVAFCPDCRIQYIPCPKCTETCHSAELDVFVTMSREHICGRVCFTKFIGLHDDDAKRSRKIPGLTDTIPFYVEDAVTLHTGYSDDCVQFEDAELQEHCDCLSPTADCDGWSTFWRCHECNYVFGTTDN